MDPAANSSFNDDSSSEERHVADPVREAISTINGGNGVDIDGIYDFVKARHSVMPNYKDVLEVELNTRVSENELEKVDSLYRIIHVVRSGNTNETTEPESDEPVAVTDLPNTASGETFDNVLVKAIRTLNDGNGADIDEICEYIKGSYDLGPNRRNLVDEYMYLGFSNTEIEKVENRYRIVNVTSEDTNKTTDYILPYGDMPEAMVIEAIAAMDYGLGVDVGEIFQYIENRFKIPSNYMKILEDELNKRVSENELQKVEGGYKVLGVTSDNMDEAQSQAVAVADQKDPAKSSSSSSDATTSSRNKPYNQPVMDAVSTVNGGNGVDIEGILKFIKAKYPRVSSQNYRKPLENWLKRSVSLCILEKVETHYKILNLTPEKVAEISEATAKAVAVSDQKELEAKEASEAADRAKKVLEENELVLKMAKEAVDRCTRGD